MSGQSIVDRLNAAKHTVAGSALGRAVVKATTEEVMGPKRKHLDYLLQCTSEINVSIPQMADLLIERTQNTSWVVSFKALITIHHLMCYGNERFSQYMASHNSKFILNNFIDRTGTQGIDMSSYIRKYAHYLNEKRETYKLMGYDFCKVKRGKDDGMLRTMNTEKLLKTLPILQKQLDALVQFDVQPNELTNAVINTCFVLLSKDLIRLFACYNDGIINLLEKFFDMNKKNCKEALDIYKKFLERTDHVSQFLKVAESSGMDKSEIPDLTKAPGSLLEALEAHVNGTDPKKPSAGPTNKPSTAVTNAINSLNGNTNTNNKLSDEEKRRIVEEEAKTLETYKSNHLKKQTSLSSPTNENIFGSTNGTTPVTNTVQKNSATPSSQNDLFGLDLGSSAPLNNDANKNGNSSASNDLLMLSGPNPFIQNIVNQSYSQQNMAGMATNGGMMAPNPFGVSNGMMMQGSAGMFQPPINNFAPVNPIVNNNFNQNKLNDLFSGIEFGASSSSQIKTSNSSSNITANGTDFDAFGDVLQPTNKAPVLNPSNTKSNSNLVDKNGTEQKILSADLDSSLASLANNLDINHKNNNFQKNHQWNSNAQQGQAKTGGQQWKQNPQPTIAPPMSAAWAPTNNASMGGAVNQNWMAGGSNPFAAPSPLPMQQPLGAASMQPPKPAVSSSNNPFDLF